MAINQEARHELGRDGQEIIKQKFGGDQQSHKAPFDVVDFTLGIAYEVKTMSGLSADLKIHISAESMKRKRAFLREYGIKAKLVAVVIYSPERIEVYTHRLVNSVRINQMKLVK